MNYATVCSGIEAPSLAWHSLGWSPVWFSEIEKNNPDIFGLFGTMYLYLK